MPLIERPFVYVNQTVIDALQLDSNLDTAYNLLNGNLDEANIKSGINQDMNGIINVKSPAYKAAGSAQSTTGSINAGSNILTLGAPIDFINGHGINVNGKIEVDSLQITAAATVSSNVTVTLNGVAFQVAVLAGDTIAQVATKIRAAVYTGWTAGGVAGSDTITFTSTATGTRTTPTYSAGTTTATGVFTVTTLGTADLITSIVNGAGTTTLTLAVSATTAATSQTVSHDDTAALQSAINNAVSSKIAKVSLPAGTYITSKPLYVWGAYNNENTQVYLIGDAYNTTFIKKTSHGILNDGSANASIDAILILFNYDMSTHDTTGQMISDITLSGLVGTNDYVQYGIYSASHVAYTKYENIQINNCKRGLYFNQNFFQNQIRNVVMYITEYGVYIGATGTSNWLEKMLIVGATITAYKLNGIYSAGASLVAQNTSGIVYDIAYGDWSFNGLGEESSTGNVVLQATNATVHVSGATFLGLVGAASTVIKAGNNSSIIVNGGTIGNGNSSAGKLYETESNSQVVLGVTIKDTYSTVPSDGGVQSSATIKNEFSTPINLFLGHRRPYIGINRRRRASVDYYNTAPVTTGKAIFLGCKDVPITDSDGTDMQYQANGNQGDIFLVDDPGKNGILGWVIIADTANTNGPLRDCTFSQIPLWGGAIATGSRPKTAAQGLQCYDNTLNKPIWCKTASVYEVDTVTVTAAATAAGNVTVTLNGVATNIAVLLGDSTATIASKIAATAFANWLTSVVGSVVTFKSILGGTKSAPSYSAGTTGATATAAVSTAGTNPAWVDATGTTV